MGAKSPLLWEAGQVDSLLAGSPVVNMVKDRLKVTCADVASIPVSQPYNNSPNVAAPGQQP